MSSSADIDQKKARRRERRVRWFSRIGLVVVRAIGLTWRYTEHNSDAWRSIVRDKKNFVLAIWHGDLLAAVYTHRGQGLVAVVSEHSDGEIIARIIAALGFGTARGSSTRGGARALLSVVRELDAGSCVAFTPDGPRGPRHVAQPGVVAAAQRSSVPIIGMGLAASRAWRFKSWDRFMVPKPFARVSIVYADAFTVDPDAKDLSGEAKRFGEVLNSATASAERLLEAR